jgi:hypothetical protein
MNTNETSLGQYHHFPSDLHYLQYLEYAQAHDQSSPSSLWLLTLPSQPSAFLRATTDDHANPNCPIKLAHGTTTLAFRFQGGIIVATDSRATAGNWIASQTVKKVIEINSTLLGTMAGGAAVSLEKYSLYLTSFSVIHFHSTLSHSFANNLPTGLPVLACIPWHPMSLTRTPTQTPHIRRRSLEDPRKPCLLLQRHGSVYGNNDHRRDSPRGPRVVLH